MARRVRGLSALVAVVFMASGCFGSFNLTRNVWKWNKDVSQEKWVQELVFLGIGMLVPVYGVAAFLDYMIINSIEFWTGENPVEFSKLEEGESIELSRTSEGDVEMTMVLSKVEGQPVVTFNRFEDGTLSRQWQATRDNGVAQIRSNGQVLASAITLPDGGVLLRDAHGEQIGFFYGSEVNAFFEGEFKSEQLAARISAPQTAQTAMALH